MTKFKNIRSTIRPNATRFDEKSVWVSENIREIEVERDGDAYTEFEFDQTQYSKDEYIKLLDEKNQELEAELTDTQLALCEIYERVI